MYPSKCKPTPNHNTRKSCVATQSAQELLATPPPPIMPSWRGV